MQVSTAVRNEQVKLLATAVNNVGVATLVTGVIAPTVGYLIGSLYVDHPLRLLSVISIICGHRSVSAAACPRDPERPGVMSTTDIALVAPAFILGFIGWAISEFSIRSSRRYKAQLAREAAEHARTTLNP